MTSHHNRSKASEGGGSYVIYLPAVKRLWKHHQAASEAVFSSHHNAQRIVDGFSRSKGGAAKIPGSALIGAKVMRVICAASRYIDEPPPEFGAMSLQGWWLIEA